MPTLNILDVVHREEILFDDTRHACVKIDRRDLNPFRAGGVVVGPECTDFKKLKASKWRLM